MSLPLPILHVGTPWGEGDIRCWGERSYWARQDNTSESRHSRGTICRTLQYPRSFITACLPACLAAGRKEKWEKNCAHVTTRNSLQHATKHSPGKSGVFTERSWRACDRGFGSPRVKNLFKQLQNEAVLCVKYSTTFQRGKLTHMITAYFQNWELFNNGKRLQ